MNIFFVIILVFSLLMSTVTSVWFLKMNNKKCQARFVAFCVNSLILSMATIVLYKLDVQTFHKQVDGLFGSLGILVLAFFVPIITFINFYTLEFIKNKSENLSN